MRKGTIKSENLTLYDLLTADFYDEIVKVKDSKYDKSHSLIPSSEIFFEEEGPFVKPESNMLVKINSNNRENIGLDNLLKQLQESGSTCVVFFEGFAGCGKSTLVQYILSKQLHSYNFDHNLFNYNLEAQNDINIRDKSGIIVKESSIFSSIINCFIEAFAQVAREHTEVINDFNRLLEYCENYLPFQDIYLKLYNTNTYQNVLREVKNGKNSANIKNYLMAQIKWIRGISKCILALDYLLRLSMYKHRLIEDLYICYDNLDAIENAQDLVGFDNKLIEFKGLIDDFIDYIYNDGFFADQATPHFIILTTYRKITASLAGIADAASEYREVACDYHEGDDQTQCIWHIDATSIFSYRKIVAKRKEYFFKHLISHLGMSECKINILKKHLQSWESLNKNLIIMDDRYSSLWNKNYKTCSLIANELFSTAEYDFETCVKFINKDSSPDGYDESTDDEGDNILCSYYGGSAIILSCVCKVFHNKKIWNEFLDLSNLESSRPSYKNVSLARLILTYIYNLNRPASLKELYNAFCAKNMFSYEKLCKILSKMLARNPGGFWRRPIYYANACILEENAKEIEMRLMNECEQLYNMIEPSQNYTFLLCDSGKAYVERLMSEFEFFSNRLSNENNCLYLYTDIANIKTIIESVLGAVSHCCDNILKFREKYIKDYDIPEEKYLTLPFHPTTNRHSSQLHIERTIFSHIAYLNNVRLYFVDERITQELRKRKEYNSMFVDYIDEYLELYAAKILPICKKRKHVYNQLKEKVDKIKQVNDCDGNNVKILFAPISLSQHKK